MAEETRLWRDISAEPYLNQALQAVTLKANPSSSKFLTLWYGSVLSCMNIAVSSQPYSSAGSEN